MGSLWTPGGEHEVPREPAGGADESGAGTGGDTGSPAGDPLRAAAAALGVDLDAMGEEDREQLRAELEEMMAVRRQVASTPAADMLANHLMRLFDLATIYMEADPPALGDAVTVIEGFRGLLDGVGGRLGEHQPVLREALGQLQMLFVQVKDSAGDAGGDTPSST